MTTSPDQRTAAIVTGHSRGLGASVAYELLRRGIAVLGVSRSPRAAGGPIEEASVDLSDERQLLDWLGSGAIERFVGGIEPSVTL